MSTTPRKVIKSPDSMAVAISRRVPHDGTARIDMGSVCEVEASQVGVLVRDGQTFDVLGPGRHTLTPSELPLLSGSLIGRPARRAPFEAAIHFVSQRVYTGMKWGTPEPLTFLDGSRGAVRLRAFGIYTIRVADATLFLNTVTGAQETLTTRQLEEHLQGVIVSRLEDLLEDRVKSLSELPTLYSELATEVRLELKQDFGRSGIDLIDFFITSDVPTGEVQGAAAHGSGEGQGLILREAFQEDTGLRSEVTCPHCGNGVEKICRDCREALPPGAKFCPRCGADQGGHPAAAHPRRRSG